MKNLLSILCLSALTAFVFSCEQKDPKLEEATALHETSMKSLDSLKNVVSEIESLREQLKASIQRMETAEGSDSVKIAQMIEASVELKGAEDALTEWEASFQHVPGMEHGHEHSHAESGDDHNHMPAPDLTPDQALAIQQESATKISEIAAGMSAAISKAKALLQM